MKKILLLAAIVFCCFKYSNSQPGKLDSSFGNNGLVTANFAADYVYPCNAQKVLVQSDGSIYVVFEAVGRSSGSIDLTFVSKRKSDGAIDSSYGDHGFSRGVRFSSQIAIASASQITAALQPDGKVVLAGLIYTGNNNEFAIVRFNNDGSLDESFSDDDAKQITGFGPNSVAIQADGKIVVAGLTSGIDFDFGVLRFNPNGTLDSSFSNHGKQITDFDTSDDRGHAVAIQTDGKILVMGSSFNGSSSDLLVVRYNSDGSLDSTFSDDGKQITDFNGSYDRADGVVVLSDGKIVAGGISITDTGTVFALARYHTDGRLDSSFSDGGKQTTFITKETYYQSSTSIAVQNDDKILIGGFGTEIFLDKNELVRYNTDGSLDHTFGDNGIQISSFTISSIALQTNGKIVVAGSSNMGRYTTIGNTDSTFGINGQLDYSIHRGNTSFTSTAIQKDGKIVVAGSVLSDTNSLALVRYNTDGTLDESFSDNAKQVTNFSASSVAIQTDGKILVAGQYSTSIYADFGLVRFNTDGSLDSSFSNDGKQITDFNGYFDRGRAVAIQNDGKILVIGSAISFLEDGRARHNFAVARYNSNGTLDETFSDDGKQTSYFLENYAGDPQSAEQNHASSLAIQADGKIVVAGYAWDDTYTYEFNLALVRYKTDGSLDSSFSGDGKQSTGFGEYVDALAYSVAIQNDGKIVVAGFRNDYPRELIITRYNIDGSLDNTFDSDGIQTNNFGSYAIANSIAIQSDGKIVVGGEIYDKNFSKSNFGLARYNKDGNLDNSFGKDGVKITEVTVGSDKIKNIAISGNKLYAVGTSEYLGSFGVVARYLLNDKNNTPPTITLTTPTNNSTYIAPAAHIKLSAAAFDEGGTISKVEFYNGTTLLDTETVTPYGFVWRNVPAGNYTITAKATDNSGLVTTSAAVHISVAPNKAPTVSIINPANHATYTGPANIHLEAAAKDPDGRISRVEFYNGSTLLQTEYTAPYTFIWRNVPVGNYSITAKATDNWGAVTNSAVITVSVHPNKAPTVSITNPAHGESFTSSDTIRLAASAQDPDGRITRVEFYNGSTLLLTEYKLPYTYNWTGVAAGTYTITAVATDSWGAKTTSASVIVTVTNTIIVSSKPSSIYKVTNVKEAISLKVYPSPAKDIINIYTTGLQQNKQATTSIISSSGVVMKAVQSIRLTQTIQIDVSTLVKGTYIVKVISGDKAVYKQFVKL